MSERTEEFRAMNCKDTGRYYHCELIRNNKKVDDVYGEEVNIRTHHNPENGVARMNQSAFNEKFSVTFEDDVHGVVGPQDSSFDIVLD